MIWATQPSSHTLLGLSGFWSLALVVRSRVR